MKPSHRSRSRRAIALVVVLSVIVLLSLLVVSLVVAMRLERRAAHYYAERSRADLFAREGLETVIAALHEATATNREWISMPGRVVSATGKISDPSAVTTLLFSGTAGTASPAVDLNRATLSDDEKEAITGRSGEPMRVAWIYVRKDGTRTASSTPDVGNPIVGRYAYWTDDESSRLDLNTAWKRLGNANSINHPSQVNLLAIPGLVEAEADAIHASAGNSPFNSPHDARRIDAAIAGVLSSNRFYLSHRSYSSSLNPWREPRITLTTTTNNLPPEIAGRADSTNYFLDIRTNNADPGWLAGLKNTKVLYQLNRLAVLLSTNSWPYATGSFSQKYGGLNAAQIALDAVEYVRSAESTNPVVIPLRVRYDQVTGFNFSNLTDPDATNILTGSTRRPMFSEMGIWMGPLVQPNPANTNVFRRPFTVKLEICLPKRYGISPSDLNAAILDVAARYPDALTGTNDAPSINVTATNFGATSRVVTSAGEYDFATVTFSGTQNFNFANASSSRYTNRPTSVWVRATFDDTNSVVDGVGMGSAFWEVAPNAFAKPVPAYTNNNLIEMPVDAEGIAVNAITSVQVSDPRVNKYKTNWIAGPNTLGTTNFNWRMAMVANPPQDTDSIGNVSDAGMAQRPAKGTPNNARGVVESVAELGVLPTGIAAGVPWRTVRLQPTPGATEPPDWALLDLFMAPYFPTNASFLYNPKEYTAAGRINLNARLEPFTNLMRDVSLRALFKDSTNITDYQASIAVSNLLMRVPATHGKFYGGTNGYVSVGEMAEVAGMSDAGEASERRLHGAVDLATVQGNVFRVYAVGQAVQQTASGRVVVQAEKAVEVLVERTETPGQAPAFRTVFWKVIPQ